MTKKVCPLCDQTLKVPFFCATCKRFVFHPYEWDADFYLNERHPAREADCLYHGGILEERETEDASGMEWFQRFVKWLADKNRWIVVAIAFYVMLMLIVVSVTVFDAAWRSDRHPDTPMAERVATEPLIPKEEFYHEWERTDEEVQAAGIECNSYGHFPVDTEEALPVFKSRLDEMGYGLDPFYKRSYNESYEGQTSFNTWYSCGLFDGDRAAASVTLRFDTATGRMHGMTLFGDTREDAKALQQAAFFALADLGLIPEDINVPQLVEDMLADLDGEEYYQSMDINGIMVICERMGDEFGAGYNMEILAWLAD